MAVVNVYVLDELEVANNAFLELQFGGTAPTLATGATGWVVAKLGGSNYSDMEGLVERASSSFGATALPSTAVPSFSAKNAMRTNNSITGDFAAGVWDFALVVRAVSNGGAQDGRMRFRLFKGTAGDGSNAVEFGGGVIVGSTVTNLATTADQTSSGATASLAAQSFNNEYIFIKVAWEITGAGGSNNADVLMRIGSGSRLLTPNFVEVIAGNANVTLPAWTASGTGSTSVTGEASVSLPAWTVEGAGFYGTGNPLLETLTDDFESGSLDTTKWETDNDGGGTVTITAGEAVLFSGTIRALVISKSTLAFLALNSYAYGKVVPPASPLEAQIRFDIIDANNNGYRVVTDPIWGPGTLWLKRLEAGSITADVGSIGNFDPAGEDKWWRIRFSGTAVFLGTAPDNGAGDGPGTFVEGPTEALSNNVNFDATAVRWRWGTVRHIDDNTTTKFDALNTLTVSGFTGNANVSLPAWTAAGDGETDVEGDSAVSLPAWTATGTGTTEVEGDAAVSLPAWTATGSGATSVAGDASVALPTWTASGTGAIEAEGDSAVDLPAWTSEAEGDVGPVTPVGNANVTLPAWTAEGDGTLSVGASAAVDLPAWSAAGDGETEIGGDSAVSLPAWSASGGGSVGAAGEGVAVMPAWEVAGTGTAAVSGEGAATLPAWTVSATGVSGIAEDPTLSFGGQIYPT